MNDLVNLICVLIICIIIFKLIKNDNKKVENFTDNVEFNCENIIDEIIIGFFNKFKKDSKFNEEKLKKYLEFNNYNSEKDFELLNMRIKNNNIFEELFVRNLIKKKNPDDIILKNYISIGDNEIDINPKYVFDLLNKDKDREQINEIIIKVTKNSDVFESGIIDIGKIAVTSK